MTPADIALARRAVACHRFRWVPGMQVWEIRSGEEPFQVRVYAESQGGIRVIHHGGNNWDTARFDALGIKAEHVPDFSDTATVGCLLALVREALDDARAAGAGADAPIVRAWGDVIRPLFELGLAHEVTASALVAALEAAP